MAAVEDGTNMRKVADKFHIPYSPFHKWCYGICTSRERGLPVVLNSIEEHQIIYYLVTIGKLGYGLNQTILKMKVYKITKRRWTLFINGILGKRWMTW